MVGVDQSMKAISMHLQKTNFRGKIAEVRIAVIFRTKLLHAYVQCVYIVKVKYQTALLKVVVGVDLPVYALA